MECQECAPSCHHCECQALSFPNGSKGGETSVSRRETLPRFPPEYISKFHPLSPFYPLSNPEMSHPRVEEVSESESESDPSIEDPSEYAPSLIRPSHIPPPSSSRQQQPQFQPPPNPPPTTQDTEAHKHYQCIYPLYFDAARTRAQGRRVGKEQAVDNPLARTIVDAVAALALQTVFEPGKMHPRDWGNPGRVRVLLKEGGRTTNRNIKNSQFCHKSWNLPFPTFPSFFPLPRTHIHIISPTCSRYQEIPHADGNSPHGSKNTTSTTTSPPTSSHTPQPPTPPSASASRVSRPRTPANLSPRPPCPAAGTSTPSYPCTAPR